MAGNIKGIIVEIGGDTSGLQKALKSVNSATASLSKELKGINSLLKLDPKNTELLAQKQTVLKDAIGQTEKKLESLKEVQKQADATIKNGGEISQENYRNLQREIINTENKLKELKLEASNWTAASNNLKKFSDSMSKVGDVVTNVGKKVSVVSAGIAGLFTAGTKYNADIEKSTKAFETFLGSAEEAEKAIKNIKDTAKTSIFNTSDLISANQLLITTGESSEEANKTISALGDAIALTGGGNDELSRMAANLQQIKNVGKASSVDIKQFAMAGIDVYGLLADYLGKTTTEIKNMDISYTDLSKALQKGASEGGKYFNGQSAMADTLSGKISQIKKSFQDLLGQLSESLFPVIKSFADRLQGLVNWFSNLDDKQKQTITKIGLFVAALGPAILIVGKIISLIGTFSGVLSTIAGVIAKVSVGTGGLSGVLSALTGPIGIVIAVLGTLIATFVHLYQTNDEFKAKVQEVWQSILDLYQNSIKPVIDNLASFIGDIINTIIGWVKKLWKYIEPAIQTMLTWLMDFWNNTLKDIVKNVMDFVNELINIVKMIWDKFINPVVGFLIDKLGPVFSTVFNKIWSIVSGVFDMIGNAVKMITGVFSGLIEFISGVFSGNWSKAWDGIVKIFSSIISGIGNIFKTPLNWIIDGINKFISGINKIKIPDWVPAVGGKGINIPLIPKLAKGGIVDKATLAMIGEGKSAEAVIPLDNTLTKYLAEAMRQVDNNRSVVVNFYPQKMTEAEIDNAFNYINRKYGFSF